MHQQHRPLILLGLCCLLPALTQAATGLQLTMVSEKEITVVNERGQKETRRVEPSLVVPGDEVIYTVRYRNEAAQAADNVVITNPIPEHMTYSDSSARGGDTQITYSIDGGKSFDAPERLRVPDGKGGLRPATAADYTHIRWGFKSPVPAGAEGAVSYRARLQ